MQAEAIPWLWWNWVLSPDEVHLARLERTLDWIENHQLNEACGEWFAEINAKRKVTGTSNMSYDWKSSYHTVRAMLFVEKWINDYLSQSPGNTA